MTNASTLKLTPEITELVSGAFAAGNMILLAVVDKDNKPVLSFRGSTSVFSESQLSFWARNLGGSTLEAIAQNPQVALMYRSATVPLLQFAGQARITTDAAERDRAFSLAALREQQSDPERKGAAVIIDLDKVSGVVGFNEQGPIFVNLTR